MFFQLFNYQGACKFFFVLFNLQSYYITFITLLQVLFLYFLCFLRVCSLSFYIVEISTARTKANTCLPQPRSRSLPQNTCPCSSVGNTRSHLNRVITLKQMFTCQVITLGLGNECSPVRQYPYIEKDTGSLATYVLISYQPRRASI